MARAFLTNTGLVDKCACGQWKTVKMGMCIQCTNAAAKARAKARATATE